MAAPRTKYSMQVRIKYKGRLVDVLDRIRAIRMVLMVHIEQDLGKGTELVTIKIMTQYPPRDAFSRIRQLATSKIETLEQIQFLETTLTKLQ
tara:strand:- start:787 stop:1062 length:276 start_codon:yes stop_codon:yes gene_type:complete